MSMTLRRDPIPDPTADGQQPEAETRMRRALGLLPAGKQRVRARASDGPVVEHRSDRQGSSVNRVAEAEASLAQERHAREQLTRQLRDVEAALREAQTKRGHAELARDELQEALAAERVAREIAEEQVRQLRAAADARQPEPPAPARGPTGGRSGRVRAASSLAEGVVAKRRGRPPGSVSKKSVAAKRTHQTDCEEAEAVEWWVPGWQERI
jgi:hypothetical protein